MVAAAQPLGARQLRDLPELGEPVAGLAEHRVVALEQAPSTQRNGCGVGIGGRAGVGEGDRLRRTPVAGEDQRLGALGQDQVLPAGGGRGAPVGARRLEQLDRPRVLAR